MSLLDQFKLFARYNQVMNQRQYAAVALLPNEEINRDRKAFFKSILGTLNHILVGDIVWLKRFSNCYPNQQSLLYLSTIPNPPSLHAILFDDFSQLRLERERVDQIIVNWMSELTDAEMEQCVAYTNMKGQAFHKKLSDLINHLVLHQVHHRGQVTTLLAQSDIDFGETDLVELISECRELNIIA